MRLFRFVGEHEVFQLLTNETLHNDYDWSAEYDTNSKGICFFAYNRTDNINYIINRVLDDWGFEGIVKTFALVEIEVEHARKAWGFYSGGMRTEYNLSEYSIENVTAIYRIKEEFDEKTWDSYKAHKVF